MLAGIYNAGSGLVAAEQRQQVIAENLANVDVPGFRRMFAPLSQVGTPSSSRRAAKHGVALRSVTRDFQPGVMEPTDRPLDVALQGEGFFVVEGPRGPLYTRSGVMHVDAEGRLVTASGFPFRGAAPLGPDVATDQIQINSDGSITADGQPYGQLEIVSVKNPNRLRPVGVVYFEATDGVESEPSTAAVRQGVRERSNVNATEELIQMMIGLRHHEASQRALRAVAEAIQEHAKSR